MHLEKTNEQKGAYFFHSAKIQKIYFPVNPNLVKIDLMPSMTS